MPHGLMIATAVVCFGLSCVMSADGATPAPETQPATSPEFVVSDMRVQTIPGFEYEFQSSRTTLQKLSVNASQIISDLQAAVSLGKIHPIGPLVFTYREMTDLSQPFNLDIGFIVPVGTKEFPSFKLHKTEAFKCAVVLFSGSLEHLSDAYGKVMADLGRAGLRPTGTTREFYLYWEGPQSPNNVVQIQVGID